MKNNRVEMCAVTLWTALVKKYTLLGQECQITATVGLFLDTLAWFLVSTAV